MSYNNWRGDLGIIKPTYQTGSLEEFIRLLPAGIGVIPLFLGIKTGTEKEFLSVMDQIKAKIEELANLKVDLIHPEGGPPFMLNGYKGEAEIIRSLEDKYGIPIFTSAMTQVEALKALGIKRMVGVTYFTGEINRKFAQYFTEAGFDVLGMEGMEVPFNDSGRIPAGDVYAFTKKAYLKYKDAQGVYMLGSGWNVIDIVQTLEQDLEVPVVHAMPARVWAIQKRLHIKQPVKGYGRLLEEMP